VRNAYLTVRKTDNADLKMLMCDDPLSDPIIQPIDNCDLICELIMRAHLCTVMRTLHRRCDSDYKCTQHIIMQKSGVNYAVICLSVRQGKCYCCSVRAHLCTVMRTLHRRCDSDYKCAQHIIMQSSGVNYAVICLSVRPCKCSMDGAVLAVSMHDNAIYKLICNTVIIQ
jgi:hypothetical protein